MYLNECIDIYLNVYISLEKNSNKKIVTTSFGFPYCSDRSSERV